ncbi:hypothetical protein [Microvirga massiliensis]|uniref:hypothetical protein n=1 Tax=Microvirga massiliensis TaxID=1033741 RepID=UPI000660B66C|nr:hypothetical protein [Microvirga massiliensis]
MASMTPLEYAAKYKNLEVYLYTEDQAKAAPAGQLPPGGDWQTVNVHAYRLGLKKAYQQTINSIEVFKSKVRPHLNQKDESITVWVKTVQGEVVPKTYRSRSELSENANDPFYGKGSPEECQVVLQLAVRYGVFPREKIQLYCDNGNIGLDCNGFVGNYLRHFKQGLPWDTDAKKDQKGEFDANTMIQSIMTFTGKTLPVKTLDEIEKNQLSIFLLALCDESGRILDHAKMTDGTTAYGHIMISQPGTFKKISQPGAAGPRLLREVPMFTVIESTGGHGLVDSPYRLLEVNKNGAFKVFRGVKGQTMRVRIARVI